LFYCFDGVESLFTEFSGFSVYFFVFLIAALIAFKVKVTSYQNERQHPKTNEGEQPRSSEDIYQGRTHTTYDLEQDTGLICDCNLDGIYVTGKGG
jgi:hypothetical protein